jgi:hypothetical protein
LLVASPSSRHQAKNDRIPFHRVRAVDADRVSRSSTSHSRHITGVTSTGSLAKARSTSQRVSRSIDSV